MTDSTRLLRRLLPVIRSIAGDLSSFTHMSSAQLPKGDGSMVTAADLLSERQIVDCIQRYAPETLVLGEESVAAITKSEIFEAEGRLLAVIDPIDGTDNFIAGLPFFGISVGFFRIQDRLLIPEAGIIALPRLGEMLYALQGAVRKVRLVGGIKHWARVTSRGQSKLLMLPRRYYAGTGRLRLAAVEGAAMVGRTTASSVFDLSQVITGAARATVTTAAFWDFGGSICVGHGLGLRLMNLVSGRDASILREGDFNLGHYVWTLAEPHAICEKDDFYEVAGMVQQQSDG